MTDTTTKKRRSEALRVRVRDDEREALNRLAKSLDRKPSEILRRLVREAVTGGPDFFDDGLEELRTAHRQLAAVGRNINQLAKAANRDEPIVASELRDELADVKARVEDVAGVYRGAVERARKRTVKPLRKGRAN